jgi:hypothetical protein
MNINDNNHAEAFAVPPDKVLVVEYLSCSLRVSSGESLYADLATTVDGVGALHSFFPGSSFQDGGVADKRFILSVSTRLYADPGTVVTLTVGCGLCSGPRPHRPGNLSTAPPNARGGQTTPVRCAGELCCGGYPFSLSRLGTAGW